MTHTVLLTGITGFIAKRIASDLLARGYAVKGTLRSAARGDEVRAIVPQDAQDRLSFAEVDLMADDGWDAAMAGVDAVIHAASPFPLANPKDESLIIKPAVDGSKRVMEAAQRAGVTRVVLTASMESIMHGNAGKTLTEADWSDPEAATAVAYTRSKIFAEKAAWEVVERHPEMQLTVINPGMVCGTPMDGHYGSSVNVVNRFLSGKDPMVPDFMLPVVDIADVSACHINALERDAAIGKRFICAERFMAMPELARTLAAEFPDRKIATRIAPKWMISAMALFDKELATIKNAIGLKMTLSHSAATEILGVPFVDASEAVLKTARYLDAES